MKKLITIYFNVCAVGVFLGIFTGYVVVMPYCMRNPAPEAPKWLLVWGVITMWCFGSFVFGLIVRDGGLKNNWKS